MAQNDGKDGKKERKIRSIKLYPKRQQEKCPGRPEFTGKME